MYKVLLVEDEPIVRLALKSLVDWEKYNFNLELEATNGKRAIEIIKENMDTDIIITDINMPIMNGLEFITEVNKMNISPTIIVLSAYDDYNLVRDAFKLGIYDYILKTEMRPDRILKLLLNVVKERDIIKETESANAFAMSYKRDFLKSLLIGEKIIDVEKQIQEYNLRLSKKNISVCYLLVDDFKNIEKRYTDDTLKPFMNSVKNAIYQILSENQIGEVVCLSPEEYAIMLSFDNNSLLFIRSKLNETIEKLRYYLSNYLNVNITVGISRVLGGYENIPSLYREAEQNARLRFIYGKGKNIYPENVLNLNDITSRKTLEKEGTLLRSINKIERDITSCELKNLFKLKGKEKELLKALSSLDKIRCFDELEKLSSLITEFQAERIEEIYIYYLEIVFLIIDYIIEIDEDYRNIFDINIDLFSIISSFETKKEIDNWIKEFMNEILTYILHSKTGSGSDQMKRAKQYIDQNYMNKISLQSISEDFGFSEAHFSKVFTKETGETFTSYLTKVRIEKAKELLHGTNMRVYEICEKIGYGNVEHFSRTFKKKTGYSPKQYKKKERNLEYHKKSIKGKDISLKTPQ